ncbi:hypothetical protein F4778DRAFT_526194 [Xylariomycetidae sp. FL2044]|nr:hypothetical protein F4778DRAFT_526194 [Xylariomycetidae sp. FL2044]
MEALNTIYKPPSWCADRFAVYIDNDQPGTSTLMPSSGWIDPSFTQCIPSQYTATNPTFSPGVCPEHMSIVTSTSNVVDGGSTIWTGGCCQSGFDTIAADPRFLCTSSLTSPSAFLLIPNISTTDIYTTLSTNLPKFIEHDQLTVQWEEADLQNFPPEVATHYASLMGIEFTATSESPSLTTTPDTDYESSTSASASPSRTLPSAALTFTQVASDTSSTTHSGSTSSDTTPTEAPPSETRSAATAGSSNSAETTSPGSSSTQEPAPSSIGSQSLGVRLPRASSNLLLGCIGLVGLFST